MTKILINTLITISFSISISSCVVKSNNEDTSKELKNLKSENLKLRAELDSLHSLLDDEIISPILFNNSFGQNLEIGDSIDILVGTLYNRPNYIQKVKLDIITEKSLLDSIRDNLGVYDLEYEYNFFNKDDLFTEAKFKIPYKSGEIAVVRGELTVWKDGAIKNIPIMYDLNR